MGKRIIQIVFVLLGPSVVIVDIASKVGRVAIDYVAFFGQFKRFPEVLVEKGPFAFSDDLRNVCNLIAYFGDVGRRESIGFLAERDVPVAMPVKTHHAVESGPGKENEIVGAVFGIETVTHLSKMGIAVLVGSGQQATFFFEVGSHRVSCYFAVLYAFVKVDDVWVCVAYNMDTACGSVEANNACPKKRLNPTTFKVCARLQNEVVDPWHKFGFDAL